MGTDDRSPSIAVIEQLLAQPQRFNLFQAISLLEHSYPEHPPVWESSGNAVPRVRLRSHVSLAFEPSDIRQIKASSEEAFEIETSVMGLAGAAGPLPMPFTEMLLERKGRRDQAMSEFLDIFNHRLLALLYRSRRKRHIALHQGKAHQASTVRALDAMGALDWQREHSTADSPQPWLRHTGLFAGVPRSMSALLALLRDHLQMEVDGEQFQGGWLALEPDAQARLGAPQPLGKGFALGQRIWDQGAGIKLRFPRLSADALAHLLPNGSEHRRVAWLVRRHLPHPLQVKLELEPATHTMRGLTLGGPRALRLGWTSWLAGARFNRPLPPVTLKLSSTAL